MCTVVCLGVAAERGRINTWGAGLLFTPERNMFSTMTTGETKCCRSQGRLVVAHEANPRVFPRDRDHPSHLLRATGQPCVSVCLSQRITDGEDLCTDKGRMGLSNPGGLSCRASGDSNVWWCWGWFVRVGRTATPQKVRGSCFRFIAPRADLPGGDPQLQLMRGGHACGRESLHLGDATGTSTIIKVRNITQTAIHTSM